jgi:predicted esterase
VAVVDRRRQALALSALTTLGALVSSLVLSGCPKAETEGAARSAPAAPAPAPAATEQARVRAAPTPAASSAPASAIAPTPAQAPSAQAPSALALPALEGEPLVAMAVPRYFDAVVSVPVGATRALPVVVALHGNYDRPEWQCGIWGKLVGKRGFVLCPRGIPRRGVPKSMDRWEYASDRRVALEVDAALTALSSTFGAHVDPGPVMLIGFSLGAIYGVPLLQLDPRRFPRAVLIEGGLDAWNEAKAKAFLTGGGSRLLFACGQSDCMGKAQRLAPILSRAGLPARFGGDPTAGHTYDGNVALTVDKHFAWLVEDDPRWTPLTATP